MMSLVDEKRDAIEALCLKFNVRRLDVFGSVTGALFNPSNSDIDFLVEFEQLAPAMHYECYFGLQEGLETLFGRHVDLVESASLRNPYFIKGVDATREPVYAA
ncbi:MAG: hypothetical protein GX580_11480 [Candidatus Hydrogenedens sp.]|nr:hypothetical protein [Candidatus Hydrogenedens sp.]